ncbi:hypothetical protein MRX96_017279 [Rhipicephalus microplus]
MSSHELPANANKHVRKLNIDEVVVACLQIVDKHRKLLKFTFTCQAPPTMQSQRTQPLDRQHCIDLHGNAVFSKDPKTFNYAFLPDLAASPQPALSHEPAVVDAIKTMHFYGQLLDAGAQRDLGKVQKRFWLCFKKFGYHSAAASLESSKPNCYADMDRSHRRLPTTVSAASKVLTPQDGHCDHLRFWLCFKKFGYHSAAASLESSKPNCYADMDRSHRRLPTTVSAASKVLTPQDGHCDHLR